MATIRCVFIGDKSVGKSTILSSLSNRTHIVAPTIGVDNILFEYKKIQFQCWDTSGAPQFAAVVDLFERRTPHKVYVYDTSRPDTFHIEKVQHYDSIIVANIRENQPPLDENHIAVDIRMPETIQTLLNLMSTTFEFEEPTLLVTNNQRECCTCC